MVQTCSKFWVFELGYGISTRVLHNQHATSLQGHLKSRSASFPLFLAVIVLIHHSLLGKMIGSITVQIASCHFSAAHLAFA